MSYCRSREVCRGGKHKIHASSLSCPRTLVYTPGPYCDSSSYCRVQLCHLAQTLPFLLTTSGEARSSATRSSLAGPYGVRVAASVVSSTSSRIPCSAGSLRSQAKHQDETYRYSLALCTVIWLSPRETSTTTTGPHVIRRGLAVNSNNRTGRMEQCIRRTFV